MSSPIAMALLLATLVAPMMALAAEQFQRPEWTACAADEQCVAIDGLCAPVAVHKDYQADASAYFKKRATMVKCTKPFWQPSIKEAGAKCWMERCQIVGKD